MGVFGSIGSAISSGLSAIGGAIGGALSGICGALGSALGGTAIGTAIAAISTGISTIAASLGIPVVAVVLAVVAVVCVLAVALGLKEEGKDDPDELAMKAEVADKKPEDFDSTEEYIKYLQEEVELTDEEKKKLEEMSPEERAAYQIIGCAIYMQGISEKLGLNKDKPLDVAFMHDAESLKLSPKEIVACAKAVDAIGLGTKDISDFLHENSTDTKTAIKINDAMVAAIGSEHPEMSSEDVGKKLDEMLERLG